MLKMLCVCANNHIFASSKRKRRRSDALRKMIEISKVTIAKH